MVTLKDVAQKANVSTMTVSRVINHPHLVTDELKQLVYKAMQELDYRPNVAAKGLASNRSMIIKVLILEEMDITEPYYMHLLMGIARQLDHYHYSLQLLTENSLDHGTSDGYIITGMRDEDYEWISKVKRPVVLFGENERGISFVDSDNYQGLVIATEHAIQAGYEHVIFVGIDVNMEFELSRERGYLDTMTKHKLKGEIIRMDNRSTVSEAYINEHIDHFKPNTCFVCASDRLAIGIQRALIHLEKDMPEEYGIIGFDGVFLDRIAAPHLTTVKQDVVGMGEAIVDELMELINDSSNHNPKRSFLPELIVRGTTK